MHESAVTRVQPTRGWAPLRLKEVWGYRELLYFLALRDVKVRYKQTAIGAAWAVLQPLTVMVVFTFIFGRVANLSSRRCPVRTFRAGWPGAMDLLRVLSAIREPKSQ